MSLSIGIIGLPNVGKSTLFNAITNAGIQAENYPFCTIEPNTGIVEIPDSRLGKLSDISGSSKCLPATIEFVDIAGLVKGASKGEGLGNQFLQNIRETSAIVHVVRCFDNPNVIHVDNHVNPLKDVDTIQTELLLSDLQSCEKMMDSKKKKLKGANKEEKESYTLLEKIHAHLASSQSIRTLNLLKEEAALLKQFQFLTEKRVIYIANVPEAEITLGNNYSHALTKYAHSQSDTCLLISAQIEEELASLTVSEKKDYLDTLGLKHSGLERLASASFSLLGLQTYLTTGKKETRAWTIKKGATAPQAAGVIHTDFEKGFIRANIISYEDYIACDGLKIAREKGMLRQEGKAYIMQEGDIVEFLFNV